MLEFYPNILHKYVDGKVFELIEMDMDTNYLAISGETFEEVVKP